MALALSGLPSGASAGLNPASVTADNSSTPTLTTDAATPPGTSTLTITGTGSTATHDSSTLPFVTHDLGLAAAACARLVVLDAGRVVDDGPPEGILAVPRAAVTKSLLAAVRARTGSLAGAGAARRLTANRGIDLGLSGLSSQSRRAGAVGR